MGAHARTATGGDKGGARLAEDLNDTFLKGLIEDLGIGEAGAMIMRTWGAIDRPFNTTAAAWRSSNSPIGGRCR